MDLSTFGSDVGQAIGLIVQAYDKQLLTRETARELFGINNGVEDCRIGIESGHIVEKKTTPQEMKPLQAFAAAQPLQYKQYILWFYDKQIISTRTCLEQLLRDQSEVEKEMKLLREAGRFGRAS